MPKNSIPPNVIAVLGPTAVGKSKFAIELAQKIDAEVVSADSIQVYKYFDIGTSKPSITERQIVNHHLIDIKDPDQEFNAGLFRKTAKEVIYQLIREKKRVIIVGGTFLYIKALLSGLIENVPANEDVRTSLNRLRTEKGISYLYNELKRVDPDSADKINENDFIRIQRALEVYYSTGSKMSELQIVHGFKKNEFNVLKVALHTSQENLYDAINKRVETIIRNGLLYEVRAIRSLGYGKDLKPMKSIGYKEMNHHLDAEIDLQEAIELIKRNTRRFAKRQMTWLRGEDNLIWYDTHREKDKLIKDCMNFYGL